MTISREELEAALLSAREAAMFYEEDVDEEDPEGDYAAQIQDLTELLATEEDSMARVDLAEALFCLGRDDEARAQLEIVRGAEPPDTDACFFAAALMEALGDQQEALAWLDLVAARLTTRDLAEKPEGPFLDINPVLAARRRLRRRMGLSSDELDEAVPEPDFPRRFANGDGKLNGSGDGNEGGSGDGNEGGSGDGSGDEDPASDDVRALGSTARQVMFWPRTEVPRAHQLWPQLMAHADADAVVLEREHGNRKLSEEGIARITMVPLTTAKLAEFAARTGGDPAAAQTRWACVDELVNEGDVIVWPPPRNGPCWCGSGVKYKKCCGRPDPG